MHADSGESGSERDDPKTTAGFEHELAYRYFTWKDARAPVQKAGRRHLTDRCVYPRVFIDVSFALHLQCRWGAACLVLGCVRTHAADARTLQLQGLTI